jgi:hypothetical protein
LERLLTEDPLDVSEIKVTITQLQDKATRLAAIDEEVQQKIEEDLSEDPVELENKMTDEMQTSESYRENVARWVTLGKEALTASTPQPSNGGSSSSSAEGSSTPSNGNQQEYRMTTAAASSFRLPEFRLPRFNGQDILRFPSYFDQFQSLVHQNPSITDVQRFCLLKESLSGTPLSLVDGLMVTSENYAKALELLDEAYNDPNLLLGIFVSRLHTQPMVKDPKSHLLQKLISQFEQSFQEIQNLIRRLQSGTGTLSQQDGGLAIVEYFLTPHLLSKIPEEIQISWYNRNSEPQARFSFSGLLAFLKEHVRSRQACRLLTGGSQPNHDNGNRFWQQNSSRGRPHSVTAALLTDQEKRCPKCRQDHRLFACPAFQKMETQFKWDFIKAQKRCYNCFSNLHGIQDCPSKFTCRYCHKRHHSLLCKNKPASALNATAQTFFPKAQAPPKGRFTASERNANSAPSTSSLYAGTGINGSSEQTVPMTTESFLSEPQQETKAFLQIIKLKISNPSNGKEATVHALFDSGASQTWVKQDLAAELGLKIQQKTQFKVQSFGAQSSQINSYKVDFNLESLDGSSGLLPCTAYTAKAITGPMDQYKPTKIPSHLRGLDLSNTPAYKNSTVYPAILIGAQHYWDFLTGEIIKGQPTAVRTVFGWCISGPTSKTQVNEVSSTQVFVSAHVQKIWDLCSLGITERPHEVKELVTPIIKEGRYEVNLPFKSNARPGSNYDNALQRSLALERKMSDEEMKQYDQYFETAKKEGIVVQLEEANESQGYFLPFHGVKKNEKLRIVFDGSSKDRRTNSSLNDTLHAGENTFNQLYDVLVRFRQFEHPIVGDVVKAFHQISVAPADRQWMKFTWKGITYSFARVPFGLASSSYLLHICLQHRFKSLKDEQLSELLLKGNYVDDFPLSFVTTEEREEFRRKAAQTLATVKMTLTEEVKSNKVLGISWERESDQFLFDLTALAQPKKFTKREMLRCLASVFDPLGILNPFVMRLKVLFQHTWTLSLKWDDLVPTEVKETWKKWIEEARSLVISIPRWIGLNTKDWTLVCFTDASSSSLGITLYCVLEGESSHLLASKSRLCPLKPTTLTIPRAELVALLLGIRMIHRFVSEMKPPAQIYLYTDSETCIRWINSPPPRSETFLFNRIREIHEKGSQNNVQVRHVRSHLNPADLPTKGSSASELMRSNMWLHGPEFLMSPIEEWPSNLIAIPQQHCMTADVQKKPLLAIEDFSSIERVICTTAWLRRFVTFKSNRSQVKTGPLQASEKEEELFFWIRKEQERFFPEEFARLKEGERILCTSPIIKLRPRWNAELALISVQSRSEERQFILLPARSHLTELIIKQRHERNLHQGAFSTLCDLRRDYWVPQGMSRVKAVIFNCRVCRRFRTRLLVPREAPLPKFRITAAPAFMHVAIDHLGPLTLSTGQKTWTLVFSCGVTRAVHLELCKDLSAHESYLKLRAFLALRVPPNSVVHVYSDNATTFRKISTMKYPHHQLRWRFSVPANPSSLGLVERIVGLTKNVLRVSFRHSTLPLDELAVILHEISACLNLRPLTPVSTDINDHDPLTPSSFLYGAPPPPTLNDGQVAPTPSLPRRFLLRSKLIDHIWRRWFRQYLPLLRSWRAKLSPDKPLVQKGDLVLIEAPTSRGLWPVARVTELITGADGVVRAVHVLLKGRHTRRALRHIAPLEPTSDEGSTPECPAIPLPEATQEASATSSEGSVNEPLRTRSGRIIRQPARL